MVYTSLCSCALPFDNFTPLQYCLSAQSAPRQYFDEPFPGAATELRVNCWFTPFYLVGIIAPLPRHLKLPDPERTLWSLFLGYARLLRLLSSIDP